MQATVIITFILSNSFWIMGYAKIIDIEKYRVNKVKLYYLFKDAMAMASR
jgi:hypothetical protein